MTTLDHDPADVAAVIQAVRFELYRENVRGALDLLEAAHARHPDPRYAEQVARIRSWLGHLDSREAYIAAQEDQYHGLRATGGLKLLERRLRAWLGRKTRKMVARRSEDAEFLELEREVVALGARRVLDAGCGEGGIAMALGARHPEVRVEGVEISATNTRIAGQLNRYRNVAFRQGLAEEVHRHFPAGSFDLAYSFAVLEHVRDVDETVGSIASVLRPGGRFCFVVPMREFRITGEIPEYAPVHGYADHCRVFDVADLTARFGARPGFRLVKIPGNYKRDEMPACFEPVEFGVYFVAFTKG
ncbi:MAG: methyltransferase domain-containing protein [Candidatus Rokubacteria bacterium]|nr:methyltransferase domain-containing protein [Candidatus Rokubacteria bacterium]MBI3825309.1 methyltransferase domain-containing protein [Candidatus Rokubacteria bacterium]